MKIQTIKAYAVGYTQKNGKYHIDQDFLDDDNFEFYPYVIFSKMNEAKKFNKEKRDNGWEIKPIEIVLKLNKNKQ